MTADIPTPLESDPHALFAGPREPGSQPQTPSINTDDEAAATGHASASSPSIDSITAVPERLVGASGSSPGTPRTPGVFHNRRFWAAELVGIASLAAGLVTGALFTAVPDVTGMTPHDALGVIEAASEGTWTATAQSHTRISASPAVLTRMRFASGGSEDGLTVAATDPETGTLHARYDSDETVILYVDGFDELEDERDAAIQHELSESSRAGYVSEEYDDQDAYIVFSEYAPRSSSDYGDSLSQESFAASHQDWYDDLSVSTGSSVIMCDYTRDGYLLGVVVAAHPWAKDDEKVAIAKRADQLTKAADDFAREHADERIQEFIDGSARSENITGGSWQWMDDDNVIIYVQSRYSDTVWSGTKAEIDETKARFQTVAQWIARMVRANVTIKLVNSGGDAFDSYSAECDAWPDFYQQLGVTSGSGEDSGDAPDASGGATT